MTDSIVEADLFRHITPEGAFRDHNLGLRMIADKDGPEGEILSQVNGLAEAAAAFYRGIYPYESPYFWWGAGDELPWHKKYWEDDGDTQLPLPIGQEVHDVAVALFVGIHPGELPAIIQTFVKARPPQLAHEIQGFAVETLVVLDYFVHHFKAAQLVEAMPCLMGANQRIIEATMASERLLNSASTSARTAANVRHAENRAMKAQVFEWYATHRHEFTSMDAAASAAAGKIVPVTFRTVREWIAQFHKQHRSARTP